jgi:hypothetical protein
MPDLDCGDFPPLLFFLLVLLGRVWQASQESEHEKQKRRKSAAVQNVAPKKDFVPPKLARVFLPLA